MSISFSASGSTKQTQAFLEKMAVGDLLIGLEAYAQQVVAALAAATPQETGLTATSWGYEIVQDGNSIFINFFNTNENEGANIAVLIQYGHATGTGAYITGVDFINPATQPIFDQIVEDIWRKVTTA